MSKQINVALIGNPNTGKTSVFNALTGLNQKVGNYPGITVEKKEGICKLPRGVKAHIIDLPGTYSLNASSLDENVVIELLLNKNDKDYPDVAVIVTDVENLKRNLLLFTQIKDLKIPTILVINMADRMKRTGISLNIPALEEQLNTKIALVSTRKNEGIDNLKQQISSFKELSVKPCLSASEIDSHCVLERDAGGTSAASALVVVEVRRGRLAPPAREKVNKDPMTRNRSETYQTFMMNQCN